MPIPSDTTTRLGGWLFRHRTSLPLPVAIAILTLRIGEAPPSAVLVASGVAVTLAGELTRMWGVHHIGAISRTRSERLGPLVASGPFARLRNPLYVGNIALWVGFALTARLVWLAPVILVLLGLEYHAIVRWEESLLESRLGQAYRDYALRRDGNAARGKELFFAQQKTACALCHTVEARAGRRGRICSRSATRFRAAN